MKKLIIVITLISINAFAGREGGGGKGFVCRYPDGKIKSVELLDLWEERVIRKRKPLELTGDLKTNLVAAIDRAKNMYSEADLIKLDGTTWKSNVQTFEELIFIANGIVGLSNLANVERFDGVTLTETEDSFEDMVPNEPGCRLEQVAKFIDTPNSTRWQINMDLVKEMDLTNLIALGLHESTYRFLKIRTGEANSLRVRRIVGRVMSGGNFLSIQDQLKKPYIRCSSNIMKEVQELAKKDPFMAIAYMRVNNATFYLVQDPQVSVPHLKGIVERVGTMVPIDFNHQDQVYYYVNPSSTAEEYFKKMKSKNKNMGLTMTGRWDDIEFQTRIQVSFNAGFANLEVSSATGFEKDLPSVKKLKCELVK